VRAKEGLARTTELLAGAVPREIEVREHGVRYLAAPWDGQKTGAFLDQRENRVRAGQLARGRGLDCFSYHGSFALHLAQRAERVTAVDSSGAALARARENAARNDLATIDFVEADVFDFLRDAESRGEHYDTIVLDPPAFAKTRSSLAAALRGYKEINLRAMRLLAPGGMLFTASCSFHLSKPMFLDMLTSAAADSGRRITPCLHDSGDRAAAATAREALAVVDVPARDGGVGLVAAGGRTPEHRADGADQAAEARNA